MKINLRHRKLYLVAPFLIHAVKQNQTIHILLQSDVATSVLNTPHCPLIHQTAFIHACMHTKVDPSHWPTIQGGG